MAMSSTEMQREKQTRNEIIPQNRELGPLMSKSSTNLTGPWAALCTPSLSFRLFLLLKEGAGYPCLHGCHSYLQFASVSGVCLQQFRFPPAALEGLDHPIDSSHPNSPTPQEQASKLKLQIREAGYYFTGVIIRAGSKLY